MMFLLGVYVGGFVITLVLITVVIRLEEQSSAEVTQTWWYIWLPSLVWPFSVPCFIVAYIDVFIRWVLTRSIPAPPPRPAGHPVACARCGVQVPPKARYCGRCGLRLMSKR